MWKHNNFINLQLCAGETWVLNESLSSQSFGIVDVAFSSNGSDYTKFSRYYKTDMLGEVEQDYVAFYTSDTDYVTVYDTGTWTDQAYRTITFATAPTGDLLTWLQANGTKQSIPQPTLTFKHFYDAGTIGTGTVKFRHYSQQEPSSGATLIDFTINGTAYQAEQGMTWAEWCDSSYNTASPSYYINLYGQVTNIHYGGGGGNNVTTDKSYYNYVNSTDVITATAYYQGVAN